MSSQSASKKVFKFCGALFSCALIVCILTTGVVYTVYKLSDSPFIKNSFIYKVDPGTRTFNELTQSYFDEEELRLLGVVQLPEGFTVQETYKNIKFVRSPKKAYTATQLYLIKRFIDQTPQKLLSPGPTAIVTYKEGEVHEPDFANGKLQAFASGSYVFFNDRSFDPDPDANKTIDNTYRTFEHELVHVSQFNEVARSESWFAIYNNARSKKGWIETFEDSEVCKSFAKAGNWRRSDSGEKIQYTLINPDTEKTNTYAKTQIIEDMAETVSGVISTRDSDYSDTRKEWALEFLSEPIENLKPNKFPHAASFVNLQTDGLKYDLDVIEKYRKNPDYKYIDVQPLLVKKLHAIEETKDYLASELPVRGWKGTFTKTVDKHNVIYYKGTFTGSDRDMFIDIFSYDDGKGFLSKPDGTLIIVINGYK